MEYNPVLNLIFGFIYNRKKPFHKLFSRYKRCMLCNNFKFLINEKILKRSFTIAAESIYVVPTLSKVSQTWRQIGNWTKNKVMTLYI